MKIWFTKKQNKTKQKDQKKKKKVSNGKTWTPDLWRERSTGYLLRHDN